MKISKSSSKLMITFCAGPGTMCPRMSVTGTEAKFADDYHGSVKASKKLLSKFFDK